jgi:hypothetical protein
MFTLHRLATAAQAERDREWLATLPQQLPAADACEISQFWSDTLDGSLDESSCQVALAWLLSATIDAYPSGNLIQKSNTIRWIERVLDETNILRSDTIPIKN